MSTADELLKAETIDLRYRIAASEARVRELERIIRLAQQDKPAEEMRERAAKLIEHYMKELATADVPVYVGDYKMLAIKIRALPVE